MPKVRAAALMLKFIWDTLHITGFFCKTWTRQKAFEKTTCGYVAAGRSRFYNHSQKPKDDLEMHFQMFADYLHLCAHMFLQFRTPRLSSLFLSSLAKNKTEQNKQKIKINFSVSLLFLIQTNGVNIHLVTHIRHLRVVLDTSLSLTVYI